MIPDLKGLGIWGWGQVMGYKHKNNAKCALRKASVTSE